jgi:hypothetical protein
MLPAALIVRSLAGSLTSVLGQRNHLTARIQELLEVHPLSQVLTSMPRIGVRTGAGVLIDARDASSLPSAAHLAAYAGLAPAPCSSDSCIRGEQPSRRGNKQLKRGPSSSPHSQPWPTRNPGPATTRRSPRANSRAEVDGFQGHFVDALGGGDPHGAGCAGGDLVESVVAPAHQGAGSTVGEDLGRDRGKFALGTAPRGGAGAGRVGQRSSIGKSPKIQVPPPRPPR